MFLSHVYIMIEIIWPLLEQLLISFNEPIAQEQLLLNHEDLPRHRRSFGHLDLDADAETVNNTAGVLCKPLQISYNGITCLGYITSNYEYLHDTRNSWNTVCKMDMIEKCLCKDCDACPRAIAINLWGAIGHRFVNVGDHHKSWAFHWVNTTRLQMFHKRGPYPQHFPEAEMCHSCPFPIVMLNLTSVV